MQEFQGDDAPLRATMFQAVGLNAIAATEMRRDRWVKSTRVERSREVAIAVESGRVVVHVEERDKDEATDVCVHFGGGFHAPACPSLKRFNLAHNWSSLIGRGLLVAIARPTPMVVALSLPPHGCL